MMNSQHISQITLIKTFSTTQKYTVHTHLQGKSFVYQIQVDASTSVESFIAEAIAALREDCPRFDPASDRLTIELYAARKSGRKISDLPSFEGQQKILKTGQKCFFLLVEQKEVSFTTKTSTVSSKSIKVEMKPLQLKSSEHPNEKERGCFCFS